MTDVLDALQKEYAQAKEQAGHVPDPVIECFLRPEAYDVDVGFLADKYIVKVVAVDERCLEPPARFIHGGGSYELDAKTLRIITAHRGE